MAHLPLNQLAARLNALLSAQLPLARIGCSDTKAAWRPNETQIKWELDDERRDSTERMKTIQTSTLT